MKLKDLFKSKIYKKVYFAGAKASIDALLGYK